MSTTNDKKKVVLTEVGLFYAAAIWGATFFMVKSALSGIDPIIMVGYRFVLAGVVLLAFLLFRKKDVLRDLKKSLFLAVILFLLYGSQTVGLRYTTASNSGFITGLFVMFIPLFLKTIFKRQPTRMEVIASIVSLLGLWILTGGMHDVNTGDVLTLLAAVTYALHVLYSDKYMKAGIDPLVISCQQFLLVGIMSLIAGFLVGLPFEVTTTQAVWTVVFLALLPTLSAFVIQMYAQQIISPVRVSLIFALEPVFAAVFAWTLGGETFVVRRALGGLLIFLALIISGLPSPAKWRARKAEASRISSPN